MAQQKKAKMGRPKLPKGKVKGRIVPVRFADDEIKALVRASRKAKMSTSEMVRSAVMEKLRTPFQPHTPAGSNWDGKPIPQPQEINCESCGKPIEGVTIDSLVPKILCDECRGRQE